MIGSSLSPQWWFFFRVLSNRFFSCVINVLFPACRFFLSKRATIFLLKTDVLFYIIFLKRTLHITISSKKVKKYLHDTDTKYHIENVYHQFLDLQINLYRWIYSSYILYEKFNKILQEPDWPFVTFWNLKSLCFTCSHSFSFVVPFPVIHCHS